MSTLRDALVEAASGKREALESFLAALLNTDVYVPLQVVPIVTEESGQPTVTAVASDTLVYVRHHGRRVLPIFTSEAMVSSWTDQEQPVVAKPFIALLWLIKGDEWLHLDPGSEVGKEFSPWEIALLREGTAAIPEIVSDLIEESDEVLGVEDTPPAFAALKNHLRIAFEAYTEVEEAFLIAGKEEETREIFPIVLLKQSGISFEKRSQLATEIEAAAEAILGRKMVSIIDDIGREDSPNRKLLVGFTPFYMAQKVLPSQERPSLFQQLKARIFKSRQIIDT